MPLQSELARWLEELGLPRGDLPICFAAMLDRLHDDQLTLGIQTIEHAIVAHTELVESGEVGLQSFVLDLWRMLSEPRQAIQDSAAHRRVELLELVFRAPQYAQLVHLGPQAALDLFKCGDLLSPLANCLVALQELVQELRTKLKLLVGV